MSVEVMTMDVRTFKCDVCGGRRRKRGKGYDGFTVRVGRRVVRPGSIGATGTLHLCSAACLARQAARGTYSLREESKSTGDLASVSSVDVADARQAALDAAENVVRLYQSLPGGGTPIRETLAAVEALDVALSDVELAMTDPPRTVKDGEGLIQRLRSREELRHEAKLARARIQQARIDG